MNDDFHFAYTSPHIINAMIEVRDGKGDSFGTLLLMSCDVSEEIIARYGRGGYTQAHGAEGTDGEVLRFMAKKYSVYESEFVGYLGFMPGINDEIWKKTRDGFTVNRFKNHEMNNVPLNTVLRFLKNPADGEPELDRAMRRVFTDVLDAQLPLLARAFEIGDDTVTLDRTEQKFLTLMIAFRSYQQAQAMGVETVNGEPIDVVLKNFQDSAIAFLHENVPVEQTDVFFEKINRLFPFWDYPGDEDDEDPGGTEKDVP